MIKSIKVPGSRQSWKCFPKKWRWIPQFNPSQLSSQTSDAANPCDPQRPVPLPPLGSPGRLQGQKAVSSACLRREGLQVTAPIHNLPFVQARLGGRNPINVLALPKLQQKLVYVRLALQLRPFWRPSLSWIILISIKLCLYEELFRKNSTYIR